MALYNLTFSDGHVLHSTEPGMLVVLEAFNNSAAAQVLNPFTTEAAEVRFPRITDDVAAAWTAEGAEIALDDMAVDEVVTPIAKLAALTKISVEAGKDLRSENVVQMTRESIGRDLGRKLDAAAFGDIAAPAPAGLASYTGFNPISSDLTNLDAFTAAQAHAETRATRVRAWVANPADALAIAQLKQGSGSNVPLVTPDVTSPSGRSVLGAPLYVSAAQPVGSILAIPEGGGYLVVRTPGEFEISEHAYFSSYSLAVRGVLRAGIAVVDEASFSRITVTTPA